ncbi:MAG: DUF819 domain-containing protein [Acidobacteriota bacterium]
MISDPIAIFVVLAAVVWVSLQLEERFALFRSLGAALVGILVAMALSNIGLLPGISPTYDLLSSTGVSLAIAFILLSVDIRSVLSAGPRMLAAFALGAAGTAVGATLGALLLFRQVGPETWKLAGQFTGTYTGGGMNFAALGRALDTSSDLFTAAIAADVVVTAIWMAACLAAPLLLGRARQPSAAPQPGLGPSGAGKPITLERTLYESVRAVRIGDAAALVVIAVGALWLAGRIGALFPAFPQVLWLTTIVLIIAQLAAVQRLAGSAMWGNYLLLLFLASNGAQSVVANIFRIGPAVFYFAVTTVAVHGLVIFGIGRLVGLDLPTLAVASQANVGGPASAMALAGARGYTDDLLPGIAVGLLGYAAGNYLGFSVATLLRQLLAG